MAEEQFDPADYNVDEVNAYLADQDPEGDEYARVIQAERDGQNRVGIVGDESDPPDASEEAKTTEGYTGALGTTDGDTNAPKTVAEASDGPTPDGEQYQRGYIGAAPSRDGDKPEDLTLQGALDRQNGN